MTIEMFWKAFITKYPEFENKDYTAWAFGVDKGALAHLVKVGRKTATTSAYDDYVVEQEALPEVDEMSVVLDSEGTPQCVIRTTQVYQTRYGDITAEHAYLEGEGDRTLTYWYEVHDALFKPLFELWGKTLTDASIMVCEVLECLYTIDDVDVTTTDSASK